MSDTGGTVRLTYTEAEGTIGRLSFGTDVEEDFFFFLSIRGVKDFEPDFEVEADFIFRSRFRFRFDRFGGRSGS